MDNLRIGTLNCKGLSGEKKRRDVFKVVQTKETKHLLFTRSSY